MTKTTKYTLALLTSLLLIFNPMMSMFIHAPLRYVYLFFIILRCAVGESWDRTKSFVSSRDRNSVTQLNSLLGQNVVNFLLKPILFLFFLGKGISTMIVRDRERFMLLLLTVLYVNFNFFVLFASSIPFFGFGALLFNVLNSALEVVLFVQYLRFSVNGFDKSGDFNFEKGLFFTTTFLLMTYLIHDELIALSSALFSVLPLTLSVNYFSSALSIFSNPLMVPFISILACSSIVKWSFDLFFKNDNSASKPSMVDNKNNDGRLLTNNSISYTLFSSLLKVVNKALLFDKLRSVSTSENDTNAPGSADLGANVASSSSSSSDDDANDVSSFDDDAATATASFSYSSSRSGSPSASKRKVDDKNSPSRFFLKSPFRNSVSKVKTG